MNSLLRRLLLIILGILIAFSVLSFFSAKSPQEKEVSLKIFNELVFNDKNNDICYLKLNDKAK